jgi:hypothetical protein
MDLKCLTLNRKDQQILIITVTVFFPSHSDLFFALPSISVSFSFGIACQSAVGVLEIAGAKIKSLHHESITSASQDVGSSAFCGRK